MLAPNRALRCVNLYSIQLCQLAVRLLLQWTKLEQQRQSHLLYLAVGDGSTTTNASGFLGDTHGVMMHDYNGNLLSGCCLNYTYDAVNRPFTTGSKSAAVLAGVAQHKLTRSYTYAYASLSYYGLRYYSPSLGRFINKDPIEERGGLNLYAFCGNNGVNNFDVNGMGLWGWIKSFFQPDDGGAAPTQPAKSTSSSTGNTGADEPRVVTHVDAGEAARQMDGFTNTRAYSGTVTVTMGGSSASAAWEGASPLTLTGSSSSSDPNSVVVTTDGRRVTTSIRYGELNVIGYEESNGQLVRDAHPAATSRGFWDNISPEAAGRAAGVAYDTQQYWAQRNNTKVDMSGGLYNQLEALQFYKVVGETGADIAVTFLGGGEQKLVSGAPAAIASVRNVARRVMIYGKVATLVLTGADDAEKAAARFAEYELRRGLPVNIRPATPPKPPAGAPGP